jgi:hypothetical protein
MDYNNFKGGFFVKLGVFTVLFSDKKLDDMLDHVASKGIEAAVKLGTGGYPGDAHCKVDELLEDEKKQKEFLNNLPKKIHLFLVKEFLCEKTIYFYTFIHYH